MLWLGVDEICGEMAVVWDCGMLFLSRFLLWRRQNVLAPTLQGTFQGPSC